MPARKMFSDDELLNVSMRSVIVFCCGLPLCGFATCVVLALLLHMDGATSTHCQVANFLPSVSAAVGDYTPERYVWRLCVALHCLPRFAAAFVYRNFYQSSPLRSAHALESRLFAALCNLLAAMHLVENGSLLVLTYVSSTENHDVHRLAFVVFVTTSMTFMFLSIYLFNDSGRRRSSSQGEISFQYKILCFFISLVALLLCAYFYNRHNTYCEAGVYTLFAVCEYCVFVCIVLFHATIFYDVGDKRVTLSSSNSAYGGLLTPPAEWKST